MVTTPKEKAASPCQGEAAQQTNLSFKRTKKIDRVEAALKLPAGLNRFEAERIGEHAINSTVSVIRARYGDKLYQEWETVPSRFNPDGVRVCRYWLIGGGV